jgi:hypothetical protein
MLRQSEALFFAWHRYKEGWYDQVALQQALMPVRLAMQELLRAGVDSPYAKIAGLSRELLAQWEALWTFSRVEGVEPTGYPLGERGGAGVAGGGAVAQGQFRLAQCRGLSLCGAAVECTGAMPAAAARAVRIPDGGGRGSVGGRSSADPHSSARAGGLQCTGASPGDATERANAAPMGSIRTFNRTPLTDYRLSFVTADLDRQWHYRLTIVSITDYWAG